MAGKLQKAKPHTDKRGATVPLYPAMRKLRQLFRVGPGREPRQSVTPVLSLAEGGVGRGRSDIRSLEHNFPAMARETATGTKSPLGGKLSKGRAVLCFPAAIFPEPGILPGTQ